MYDVGARWLARGGPRAKDPRKILQEAARANDTADAQFYAGHWGRAQQGYERALRLVPVQREAPGLRLRSRISLNLAMLAFLRDRREEHDRRLRDAEAAIRELPDSRPSALLHCDLGIWRSRLHRFTGGFDAAYAELDRICNDKASDSLYVHHRVLIERANIERNACRFASAKVMLKQALRLLGDDSTNAPHWPREFVALQHLFCYHYLGVLDVERLLFQPSNSAQSREDALLAAANLRAAKELAASVDSRASYALYVGRTEKAIAWVDYLCGRYDAAAKAAERTARMCQDLGDVQAACLLRVLFAAAQAGLGNPEAEPLFEAAFERARDLRYWKGQFLAATLARRQFPGRQWDAPAEALAASCGGVPWGSAPAATRFADLVEQWREATEVTSSATAIVMHPAYQRIIGMGRSALPLIFDELSQRPGPWSWALRAITGEDPVPLEQAGSAKAAREAWLGWARRFGYAV